MKEENRIKLKFPILIVLLFLTTFTLPASNRPTTSAFGSTSMTAISLTASIPKRPQQIYIVFHYEITLIYIPTHHGPQGQPYILDMQRSVIGIVSNGELQQAYSYTPYGKTDYTKNTNMPSTIQYLSRQYDTETGDYYLINRYYNADRGTFTSPDKYQYVDSAIPFTWNLYQYGYANPLVNMDPEGLRVVDKDGQRYQGIDTVSGTELLIPQAYYSRLNRMVGNGSGTLQVTGPDGKIVTINLSASDLKNGTVATLVMEGRMLQLYGEERALDYVQITTAAAEFSSNFVAAAISVPGMGALMRMKWLAAGLGAYTAGTMSHHFGERLAERQEEGSNAFASTLGAISDVLMLSELYGAVTNRDIITGENAGYSIEQRSGILGGFVGGLFGLKRLANSYTEDVFAKVKIIDAAGSNSGPSTWNEFQQVTAGKFGSRGEAAIGWKVYKEAKYANRTLVIGRLPDTEAAVFAGFQRLQTNGWTPAVNDSWIQGAIDSGRPLKLVSPIHRTTLVSPPGSRFPYTVFRRELHQLKQADYTIRNGWALPYER